MPSVATNTRQAFLKLDQLTKVYAGRPAVDALSLEIQEGEFISLLGPSGGGKTTTLHMIAGFIQPDGGDLLLEGRSIRGLPSHRRGAAMVFQNYALFPHMTVFDNVAFGLRMQKQPRAAISRRVGEALALVQLDGLEKRYPLELSGGQQQRVALARAIVLKPRLLLLDEPLSNLDPRLRQELRDNFVEIHRLTGMTTLLVTHDLEEAFITSDRVAILGEGRLQQFDTPRNIYTRPQTAFVANFVGHTNRLHGSLVAEGDQHFLQLERSSTRIRLPGQPGPGISAYALPTHALRLEGLLRDLGPEQAVSHVQARITSLHYLGTLLRFEIELDGLKLVGETSTHSLLQELRVGDPVTAGLLASDLIPLPGEGAA